MTPVLLLILDGWGQRDESRHNAIASAQPVHFTQYWQTYPKTLLPASGENVGLPEKTIGTSEIGHMIIGSGRIIYTDLVRINKAIAENTLKDSPALRDLFTYVKTHGSTLHLLGMVSPGGVHSHQDHLFALIRLAKEEGITDVLIHVITDGRDTPPRSAAGYVRQLEQFIEAEGVGKIATVSGRYYAMDRDNNWERTDKAFTAITTDQSENKYDAGKKASEIIQEHYEKEVGDEFLEPFCMTDKGGKSLFVKEHDGVLFFNFRPDRARQLSRRFCEKMAGQIQFVMMTEYDKTLPGPVAFPPLKLHDTLAEVISSSGLNQVHIAETEKYAHVTYFLNGGNEVKHQNEDWILIESRKDVPTHDKAPEMKAKEIADTAVQKINEGIDFLVVNLANADMVGHTGIMDAAISAVKAEDEAIGRMVEAILSKNGVAVITADHGNAELMFDEDTNQPYTAHSLNPIPFIVTMKNITLRENGTMADIAPTVLKILDLPKPAAMTGESLF